MTWSPTGTRGCRRLRGRRGGPRSRNRTSPRTRRGRRQPSAVVLRLILGSALMLFLELALIRWLGANIVHLSYFTNFVLLGSFLGIGVGLPDLPQELVDPALDAGAAGPARRRRAPLPGVHRPRRRATSSSSPRSTPPDRRPGWCCRSSSLMSAADPGRAGRGRRPLLRPAAAAHGVPLGPGRLADRASAGFTVLSFLWAPVGRLGRAGRGRASRPGARLVPARWPRRRRRGDGRRRCSLETMAPGVSWSPYYKVTTETCRTRQTATRVYISVNGVPAPVDVAGRVEADPGLGDLRGAVRAPRRTRRSTTCSSSAPAPAPTSRSR